MFKAWEIRAVEDVGFHGDLILVIRGVVVRLLPSASDSHGVKAVAPALEPHLGTFDEFNTGDVLLVCLKVERRILLKGAQGEGVGTVEGVVLLLVGRTETQRSVSQTKGERARVYALTGVGHPQKLARAAIPWQGGRHGHKRALVVVMMHLGHKVGAVILAEHTVMTLHLDYDVARLGNKKVMFWWVWLIVAVLGVLTLTGTIAWATRANYPSFERPLCRIVFTMTTTPSRMAHVVPVLEALLDSSVKPDAVYLHIPDHSVREKVPYHVPPEVKALEARGVVVHYCGDDLGPITKVAPILSCETERDTIVLIADDDELPPPRYHEPLVTNLVKTGHVSAFRGFNLVRGKEKWNTRGGKVEVVEGYTGIAFRLEHLQGFTPSFLPGAPCFYTDDIVLSHWWHAKGLTLETIPGLPMGDSRGLGNLDHPMKPRNGVAALNPLSDENLQGTSRNAKCHKCLFGQS